MHHKSLNDGEDLAYRLGYRRSFVAVFTSCTDPNAPNWQKTPTYVANSLTGYYLEYEKTFQSAAAMGARGKSGVVDVNGSMYPYSTILRPVNSLERLFASERVWFDGALFTAYDAMKNGSTYQNATNNTAIIAAINSTNYGAFNSSRWLNGGLNLTGVNYFRPGIVYNDGGTIIDMLSTQITVNGGNNAGDQSVGPDLPFCFDGGYELSDKLTSLTVYAGAAQYINGDVTKPLVRYPVKATLWFKLMGDT